MRAGRSCLPGMEGAVNIPSKRLTLQSIQDPLQYSAIQKLLILRDGAFSSSLQEEYPLVRIWRMSRLFARAFLQLTPHHFSKRWPNFPLMHALGALRSGRTNKFLRRARNLFEAAKAASWSWPI